MAVGRCPLLVTIGRKFLYPFFLGLGIQDKPGNCNAIAAITLPNDCALFLQANQMRLDSPDRCESEKALNLPD